MTHICAQKWRDVSFGLVLHFVLRRFITLLTTFIAIKMNITASYKAAKLSGKEFIVEPVPAALLNSVRSKFTSNYFGLPPYSVSQSAESLAYKSRAPLDNNTYDDSEEHSAHHQLLNSDKADPTAKKNNQNSIDLPADNNYTAQRKVAKALLTMVSNDIMIRHFLFKGGLDAVLKLIQESEYWLFTRM